MNSRSIKIFLILILASIASVSSNAQVQAITEHGDTIYVYDNGTWSFYDDRMPMGDRLERFKDVKIDIDTIATLFTVSKNSKKKAKGKLGFYDLMFDEKQWDRTPPANINPEAEMAFVGKDKGMWCLLIAEGMEIGKEQLFKIAVNMMKERTGAQVEILKVEQRNVNGKDVLRGVTKVEVQGMKLIFDSYYYSCPKGSIQVTVWTGENIYEEKREKIEELLNGLIATE